MDIKTVLVRWKTNKRAYKDISTKEKCQYKKCEKCANVSVGLCYKLQSFSCLMINALMCEFSKQRETNNRNPKTPSSKLAKSFHMKGNILRYRVHTSLTNCRNGKKGRSQVRTNQKGRERQMMLIVMQPSVSHLRIRCVSVLIYSEVEEEGKLFFENGNNTVGKIYFSPAGKTLIVKKNNLTSRSI